MAVFKRNGKWWIGYPLGNGKYRREVVGPSHALAKEVLAKRLTEIAERRHFPARIANQKPFLEVADRYWQLHGRNLESKSLKWVFPRLKDRFSGKRIGDITAADIQAFYNETATSTSVATANRYLTVLRSLFNKARAWGDLHGENPCSGVKKGRETNHRLRYLSEGEIERLLTVASPRLYPILVCALMTGMRRGEILSLRWENVDLQKGVLYVLKTKSGKSRNIPLAERLRKVLIDSGPLPSGLVFDMPVIALRREFAAALKAASISHFRFHDLRHTFASHFIMRTSDLPALQMLLGHSSPVMSQRYAHLSSSHLYRGLQALEAGMPDATHKPVPVALELHRLTNDAPAHPD